eukprot:792639-Pelagomonas_calceolata.AAC.6
MHGGRFSRAAVLASCEVEQSNALTHLMPDMDIGSCLFTNSGAEIVHTHTHTHTHHHSRPAAQSAAAAAAAAAGLAAQGGSEKRGHAGLIACVRRVGAMPRDAGASVE